MSALSNPWTGRPLIVTRFNYCLALSLTSCCLGLTLVVRDADIIRACYVDVEVNVEVDVNVDNEVDVENDVEVDVVVYVEVDVKFDVEVDVEVDV